MRIERGRLREWLAELYVPANRRADSINRIIELVQQEYKGPYWDIDGLPTKEEIMIIPPCIKLGVAVRLVEIEEGLSPRLDTDRFQEELRAARVVWEQMETQDPSVVSSDPVFHDQIIPTLIRVGYESVDSSDMTNS